MARRLSPTVVGAFVLGAVALAVVAIVIFGRGNWFSRSRTFALYFESDVNGLKIGAPVKFRGVEVGSVKDIRLSLGSMVSPKTQQGAMRVRIPVLIEIDASKITGRGGQANLEDTEALDLAIRNGLRAQLALESFVTGMLYVDLDMKPDTKAKIVLGRDSPYPEIPTVPTALEQASLTAQKIIAALDKVNWNELTQNLAKTAQGIGKFVQSPELKEGLESLRATVANLTETSESLMRVADRVDAEVGPLAQSLRTRSVSANAALIEMRATMKAVQDTIEPGSPLNYQVGQALEGLTGAARSLRELSDFIERDPGALLRGRYVSGDQE